MDGKLLARCGAAVFVGLAFAMTIVQLQEEPAFVPKAASAMQFPHDDPLPDQLRACADMGERALTAPDCRAAWAEKRRRFLGVEHPEASVWLNTVAPPPVADLPVGSATGEQRGGD